MSWDRTHKHRRSLALTTTNLMMCASSRTSAPPSLTTSLWTQRSTRGLGRQLQLSLVARLECGQAPSCLWAGTTNTRAIATAMVVTSSRSTDRGPNEILSMGPRVRRDATGSRSYVLCVVSVEVLWVRRGTGCTQ